MGQRVMIAMMLIAGPDAMLMVSHELAVVAHVCDRIGVMRGGRLLEMTTAEAMAEGRVADP
jgi:peptide/nickel transport system ATP-binding protein